MTIPFTRDLSIVWLSLFCFIALLPPIVLFYFAVRGMNWVQREAKPIFQRARKGSEFVTEKVESYSNLAADPLINVKRQARRWQQMIVSLLPHRK